jgi:hypothetical protein
MLEIINAIWPGMLRSIVGWAQNSFKDGMIQTFELRELAVTTLRVGIVGIAIYYGANGLGFDLEGIAAGFSALVVDKIVEAIKECSTKKA